MAAVGARVALACAWGTRRSASQLPRTSCSILFGTVFRVGKSCVSLDLPPSASARANLLPTASKEFPLCRLGVFHLARTRLRLTE
jgi:hypothetical protein